MTQRNGLRAFLMVVCATLIGLIVAACGSSSSLQHTPYAARFKEVFGQNIFADPTKAFTPAMYAIERFELEDPSFGPYTSKFDYYLDGKMQLTEQELRDKKLFDDPAVSNCVSCHNDQPGVNGVHPLFTDLNFQALGVPRNAELRVNADPKYFDMGLCGPIRTDQSSEKPTADFSSRSRCAIPRPATCFP